MAIRFDGTIRPFREGAAGGLAVVVVPEQVVAAVGGLKQVRMVGTLNGAPFTGSTMPMGGGLLGLSVSKAAMKAGGVDPGETATFEVEPVPARSA